MMSEENLSNEGNGHFIAQGTYDQRPTLEATLSCAQDDEFFDALSSPCSDMNSKSFDSDSGKPLCISQQSAHSCSCNCISESQNSNCCTSKSTSHLCANSNVEKCSKKGKRVRRTIVPPKAEHGFSLWSLVKHCMGKDLTRIPLPVYFNEPLSTLQRLTEEYEYADLLQKALGCRDTCEQLIYIAAFVISAYSSSSKRTGKPFNPLLGETFECDRTDDLGWRCISEQVSHHPPVLAQHCEGPGWIAWQEFSMTTKLKGTSLMVVPVGINHLKFTESGYHFTWNKVSTTVHNLVIGTLWVDHHGELLVKNHTTGDECSVQFIPYRCFSGEGYRKVSGVVKDSKKVAHWSLRGTWDQKIEAAKLTNGNGEGAEQEKYHLIWKRRIPSIEDDKYYNMTLLACQLNEPEEGVSPTDSRLRPDQRLMENGQWEEANQVKMELEEKQRRKRKALEEIASEKGESEIGHKPAWFELTVDEITNNPIHVYTGEYWNCKAKADWSRCPDIFL